MNTFDNNSIDKIENILFPNEDESIEEATVEASSVSQNVADDLMEAITNVVKTSVRLVDLTSRMYISQGRFEDLISLHNDIQKVLRDHEDEYELDKAIAELQ